jgi:hypothetical protein
MQLKSKLAAQRYELALELTLVPLDKVAKMAECDLITAALAVAAHGNECQGLPNNRVLVFEADDMVGYDAAATAAAGAATAEVRTVLPVPCELLSSTAILYFAHCSSVATSAVDTCAYCCQ